MTSTTPLHQRRNATLDVPSLDGFRGLAVLWIVLGHCWNELGGRIPLDHGPLRNIFTSSYMGVDMLFIVSGFVLFLPAVVNGTLGDVKSYALRRAARIVPAFYVALVFSYAVSRYLGVDSTGAGSWFSHLLFLQSESHHHDRIGFGVNGALWTMSVEVVFYAVLPMVAAWYRRRPYVGLFLALAGAELWHLATTNLPRVLDSAGVAWKATEQAQFRMALAFPTYLAQFAIGMTAAWLYVRLRDTRRFAAPHAVVVQTAAFLGVVSVAYLRGWEGLHKVSGPLDHWTKAGDRTFFFGILVLATVLAPKIARWPVTNRVSRFLGTVCYGTYLVHLPLIRLLIPALGLQPGTMSNRALLLLIAVATPLSVGIGYLSYVFLEEPFRRWARRVRVRPVPEQPRTIALAGVRG
jgi:peptidoglycan/LPS O-acetylase OafA/YrhL